MRAPTPVTNRAIVIDSGSTSRLKRAEKPAALIQSTPLRATWRWVSSSECSPEKTTTALTKAPTTMSVAIQPASGSFR